MEREWSEMFRRDETNSQIWGLQEVFPSELNRNNGDAFRVDGPQQLTDAKHVTR